MKNFEKYIDEIYKLVNNTCINIDCDTCCLHVDGVQCSDLESFKSFLLSEYVEPITLSDDERRILKNIPSDYGYIARDIDGLFVFKYEPDLIYSHTEECNIFYGEGYYFSLYKHLFSFIENEQCYSISELLSDQNE